MFPFFFLGGLFGNWFENFWRSPVSQQTNTVMGVLELSAEGAKFIAEYEGFRSSPYVVKGENFYTIGIGSTFIFSNDGKTKRRVLASDRLTRAQAERQLQLYYNNPGSPKVGIDNLIRQHGVKLHPRFYDMLLQCSYASGSFHRSSSFLPTYVAMLKRANNSTDVKMLGELIRNTWIAYLKRLGSYSTLHGLGWSRRAYGAESYVQGLDWSMRHAVAAIKKPY